MIAMIIITPCKYFNDIEYAAYGSGSTVHLNPARSLNRGLSF
jgi:hypothetical protein